MVRSLLLSALGLLLVATEAATAQKLPTPPTATAAPKDPRTGRLLTARERRAAEKAAKAQASKASALAMATAPAASNWSGWSDDPLPETEPVAKRPATSLSVAPGMPINQVGHGVTTDYNGRPLQRTAPNTTLPSQR